VVKSIDTSRHDFYQVDGSILFVGLFFVALFLIATVLIIYYKQVTEGYDDCGPPFKSRC
jgi:putative ABC transport system permease protein